MAFVISMALGEVYSNVGFNMREPEILAAIVKFLIS